MKEKVLFKKLDDRAIMPTYATSSSAGADLYALSDGDIVIESGKTVLVHTGIAMAIPEGFVGLVFARSGLATKRGLAPANKVGVIDSDYRGEIMVPIYNQSDKDAVIESGERIAQLAIEGATMGITDNIRLVRDYENSNCKESALSLARSVVSFQEQAVERTKSFL